MVLGGEEGGGGGTNNVKNTEYIEHQQSHFKVKNN
jgi:hypothetical protein